jgi:hypothetical protein
MEWILSFFLTGYGQRSRISFFNTLRKKEFWILTNKCGYKLKHENEAEGPRGAQMLAPQPRFRVYKLVSTFNSQNQKLFFMHVLMKDVLLL